MDNLYSMSLLNVGIYTCIAVLYNIFVHNITSAMYRNEVYEEKFKKSVTILFIAGIAGIVASKLLYKNSVVSMGLCIGGALLILTSIFANWEHVSSEIKLIM